MTGRFYEITPEIMELANKCSASSIIPSDIRNIMLTVVFVI